MFDYLNGPLEIRARYIDYSMSLELVVLQRDRDGNVTHYGKPVEMVPVGTGGLPGTVIHDPHQQIGQKLMDDLWRAGVRPKDIGTPGHLAAVQKHLTDALDERNDMHEMAVKSQALIEHVLRQLVDNDVKV